ncbi:MAG: hypothetical protein ACFFDB_00700 [Promethearchaeota archaeon]
MSESQIKSEAFLLPLLGNRIICPKCFRRTLEVISINGTPFRCKKPDGCGKRMTIEDYCKFAIKEVSFSFFQDIFPNLFEIVQRWS